MKIIEHLLEITLSTTQREYIEKIYNNSESKQLPFFYRNFAKLITFALLCGIFYGIHLVVLFYILCASMVLSIILNTIATLFIAPDNYAIHINTPEKAVILDFALFNKYSAGIKPLFDSENITIIGLLIIAIMFGCYFYIPLTVAYLISNIILKLTMRDAMRNRIKLFKSS